jgi:hypothetical protein
MKKTLLAGIAALLMATSAAHAASVTLPKTDPLIGSWCLKQGSSGGSYNRGQY